MVSHSVTQPKIVGTGLSWVELQVLLFYHVREFVGFMEYVTQILVLQLQKKFQQLLVMANQTVWI